eukprot:CAMPEP_0179286282 /NCGR_PEP_ID=MMETSP0797-20121207/39659_1 /TAXON_ID=47934 /ORGANISM="Dinophysis acuminata, Strain DAEP01" /LENGTH=216 /DNA_ID=CAMNT_0020995157 /DNA_START=59 /DNA_END=707 /DNA_ORIENTATION=+
MIRQVCEVLTMLARGLPQRKIARHRPAEPEDYPGLGAGDDRRLVHLVGGQEDPRVPLLGLDLLPRDDRVPRRLHLHDDVRPQVAEALAARPGGVLVRVLVDEAPGLDVGANTAEDLVVGLAIQAWNYGLESLGQGLDGGVHAARGVELAEVAARPRGVGQEQAGPALAEGRLQQLQALGLGDEVRQQDPSGAPPAAGGPPPSGLPAGGGTTGDGAA